MKLLQTLLLLATLSEAVYHPSLKESVVSFDDQLLERINEMKANPTDTKVWLLSIGVAKYDRTDSVIYSTQSAEAFTQLAVKRFGITPRRVYSIIGDEATSARIKDSINILANNVQDGDTIIFYYSGHGIPSFPAKDPYILPKDKEPNFVTADSELKLENIYKKLQGSKAKKVVAFVDACFSGATDNKSLLDGVAATRIRAKNIELDSTKLAVMTAGQDKEFSNKFDEKQHRLFSYFVMDGILKGKTDVKSLYIDVKENVSKTSFEFGDSFKQTPTFSGNSDIGF